MQPVNRCIGCISGGKCYLPNTEFFAVDEKDGFNVVITISKSYPLIASNGVQFAQSIHSNKWYAYNTEIHAVNDQKKDYTIWIKSLEATIIE
jgi:hypothetical protein